MDTKRYGNFTSSAIWKLLTIATDKKKFGKPALTYIQEKKWEIMIGRSIDTESNTRVTLWGTFVEKLVHEKLDTSYEYFSDVRVAHPTISNWTGAADCQTETKICDIKCPQLKTFCDLLDIFKTGDFVNLKKDYPEYYWQLVSNSILYRKNIAELIVFVPYDNDIPLIKQMIENDDDNDKYKSIYYAPQSELPYLPNGCAVKDLNKFEFIVPQEDKELLTAKVLEAIKKLNK